MVAYNELIALLNNLAKERGEAKKKSENSQGIAAR
jgi:flagellar capping protein FliD